MITSRFRSQTPYSSTVTQEFFSSCNGSNILPHSIEKEEEVTGSIGPKGFFLFGAFISAEDNNNNTEKTTDWCLSLVAERKESFNGNENKHVKRKGIQEVVQELEGSERKRQKTVVTNAGEEQRNQSEIGDVANNQIVVVDAVDDPLDVATVGSILFTIKKTLTQSDTDSLCRLLLKKYVVLDHILPYLNEEQKRDVDNGEGTAIVIKDVDEYHQSAHHLIFKKSQKSGSYILKSNWKVSFVSRRCLRKGDEIGLVWDPNQACLLFSVLRLAN
ncbi:hypothetical protein IFM89_037714 [Coptis chinensis]|uniref:B3 domain-containing protein n=1 Tax=Coptis chinensis TaxID=261450 RepID=A0A835MBG5_9MAGN|nr:hypothetical protein IFM89_037714 [Coptis chinensis]